MDLQLNQRLLKKLFSYEGMLALFLLFSCCIFFKLKSISLETQAYTAKDHLQICFNRVMQTFTARVINASQSKYMRPQFLTTTQECFNDLNYDFHENALSKIALIDKNLSRISTELFWFHKKISTSIDDQKNEDIHQELVMKYELMERLKNDISLYLTKNFGANIIQTFTLNGLSFISGLFIFIGLILQMTNRKKESHFLRLLENEAEEKMKNLSLLENYKLEEYFKKILIHFNLPASLTLLGRFLENILVSKSVDLNGQKNYDELDKKHLNNSDSLIANIDKKDDVFANLQKVNLDRLVQNIGRNASWDQHIFTDVDTNIYVWGEEEGLKQAFFSVFQYIFRQLDLKNKREKIFLQTKVLGGNVIIQIKYAYLKNVKPIQEDNNLVDLDLKICEEIIKEFSGKVVVSRSDEDQTHYKFKVTILLPRVIGHVQKDTMPKEAPNFITKGL